MNIQKSTSTILVVDDDIMTSRLFKYYLESEFDYKVEIAHNGIDALEKCHHNCPRLVFMDINMPLKDGITAIKELRSCGFSVPIIVVTAAYEIETEKCHKAGANAVLLKPVTKNEFLNQARVYLHSIDQFVA